jgi:predicted esterase
MVIWGKAPYRREEAMIERNISTTIHGRYLVDASAGPQSPLLVGFHGYAERAENEYQRLSSLPGAERWLRAAVQGLHRFYRGRTGDVVASWMTSQDRDLAIADNRAYVSRVIDSVAAEWSASPILVVSGFSQGVAMAFRGAVSSTREVRGVIACGGDIPPELDKNALTRIPAVIIGRGSRDEWYTEQKLMADEGRLRDAGVRVEVFRFDGGHEWPPEFSRAAGAFLASSLA